MSSKTLYFRFYTTAAQRSCKARQVVSGQTRSRTLNLRIRSAALYPIELFGQVHEGAARLELATFGVESQRSIRLNYAPNKK